MVSKIIAKHLPGIISILMLTMNLSNGQPTLKGNAKATVLTPPLEWKYTLGGYGARMGRPAEAIHDDIHAKALVLNAGTKKYAIVTLDVLGLPPNIRPMIIEKLAGHGWHEENILLLPSHSHTSLEMFGFMMRCLRRPWHWSQNRLKGLSFCRQPRQTLSPAWPTITSLVIALKAISGASLDRACD